MRRIRRDTAGGGEIAMMAVITKAMGAFLVLMIILLPYYTSDPVAQRTADEASEQVDQAKQKLQEAQDKLKKGRLTDEEIDELVKQLEEATRQLEEALLNIRQLKIQVDQLTSQVKRLEKEVADQQQEIAALKEEIARLKEEIERLKRNQTPEARYWNTVRVEWKGCLDPRLNVYIRSSVIDTKGNFNPPPDRTAQKPPFDTDKVYTETTTTVSTYLPRPTAGSIAWVIDDIKPEEELTVYVKLLNALPGGDSQCELKATASNRPEQNNDRFNRPATGKVTDSEPYVLLARFKGGDRGSLLDTYVPKAEREKSEKEIAAAACTSMSCGLDHQAALPDFQQAIVDRFIMTLMPDFFRTIAPPAADGMAPGIGFMREMGKRYFNKQITYADISKWVTILGASVSPNGSGPAVERLRDTYTERLKEAGAPDIVLEMFQQRSTLASFDLREATLAMERAGIRRTAERSNRPEAQRTANTMVEEAIREGADPRLALPVSRIVAEGRMPLETAGQLIKLLTEFRNARQQSFSGPVADEVKGQLPRLVAPNSPVFEMLNPASGRVPPERSLPLLMQIQPM